MTSTSSNGSFGMPDERIAEYNQLVTMREDIRSVYIWVVFAVGFPANVFCILTVLTMQRMTTATYFVALLAFYDLCTLTSKLIYHQLFTHKVYIGSLGCKMAFLSLLFSIEANWVLVLICGERFIAVCFPLKKAYIVTKRRSYICSAVMFVIFLIPLALLYGIMRDSDPTGLMCGTINEYAHFWGQWYWINAFIFLFLPFPCIVLLTVLIIRGLFRSRLDRRSIMRNSSKGKDGNRRLMEEAERLEISITVMIILAAVIFLVLTLPACIFLLAYTDSITDPIVDAKWLLFEQIQFVLSDSSHAVNFLLYFFSAQRFRQQFVRIITCKSLRTERRNFKCTETFVTKYSVTLTKDDDSSCV